MITQIRFPEPIRTRMLEALKLRHGGDYEGFARACKELADVPEAMAMLRDGGDKYNDDIKALNDEAKAAVAKP